MRWRHKSNKGHTVNRKLIPVIVYMSNPEYYLSLPEAEIRKVNWCDMLTGWGFKDWPVNLDDDLWLYKVCKYVYYGTPTDHHNIISNGDGYYRLSNVNGNILLFDELGNYRDEEPNTLEKINGDTKDLDSDEFYTEQCRVLLYEWSDVEVVMPALSQTSCTYRLPDGCSLCTWPNEEYTGHTCLLKLKKSGWYRHVRGGNILNFRLDEPVEAYYSYVANNDFPLPIAVTQNMIVLVEGNCYVDRSCLPDNTNLRDIGRELYAREIPGITYKKFEADVYEHKCRTPDQDVEIIA
jgi:hypothetical protein